MAALDAILTALEAHLGPRHGEPIALAGGITNRNYRVRFDDREYVIRLPGKDTDLLGIDREAERMATEAAAALGIAPALAAVHKRCLVTSFVSCREVDSAELRCNPAEIASALRAFHDSGLTLPVTFDVPQLLRTYADIVRERGGSLPDGYGVAQRTAERIAAALAPADPVPCHDDLLGANIIRRHDDGRLLIVDWEYAGMGERLFDLGNLSVNNDFDPRADALLLEAYFGEPPSEPRRASLALMRCLSDAREGAWGAVQQTVSDLDVDFAGYAQRHFQRLCQTASGPHFEKWLHAASA